MNIETLLCTNFFPSLYQDYINTTMNSPNPRQRSSVKGNDGEVDEDIEVLRKEYRNMQANRNAFAHESDMVSMGQLYRVSSMFPASTHVQELH